MCIAKDSDMNNKRSLTGLSTELVRYSRHDHESLQRQCSQIDTTNRAQDYIPLQTRIRLRTATDQDC